MTRSNHLQLIMLGLSLLAMVLSTGLLWVPISEYGVSLWSDSGSYIRTAVNFARGDGLGQFFYQPRSDTIVYSPTTHWPPFTSIIYGFLIMLGVNPAVAPSFVSLTGWVALLTGIGFLTYRLGHSIVTASLAVIVASMQPFLLGTMSAALSEVLFLPLLVWLMVVLVDLPYRQHGRLVPLVTASFLLSLLLLTRYVGIFVVAATIFWWLWSWWSNKPRQWNALLRDMFIFSLAIIPPGIWFITTSLSSSTPATGHFTASAYSFYEGVYAFGRSMVVMAMPFVLFSRMYEGIGWLAVVSYIAVFISFVILLLKFVSIQIKSTTAPFIQLLMPHRTPIVIFLLLYTFLYTLAQPFFSFHPMDVRDATTLLCLALPWIFGSLAAMLPQRWSRPLLSAYTTLVIGLAIGPMLTHGLPTWVTLNPPRIHYLNNSEQYDPSIRSNDSGLWHYFGVGPVRARDSAKHHRELTNWLQLQVEPVVVLTNENIPIIFASQGFATMSSRGIKKWLDEGSCTSQYTMLVIVFDWRFLPFTPPEQADEPARLRATIERKCPGLYRYGYDHATVYQLGVLSQ